MKAPSQARGRALDQLVLQLGLRRERRWMFWESDKNLRRRANAVLFCGPALVTFRGEQITGFGDYIGRGWQLRHVHDLKLDGRVACAAEPGGFPALRTVVADGASVTCPLCIERWGWGESILQRVAPHSSGWWP